MKKTDYAVLTGTIAFSALFYDQFPGVNFTLFTLLLTGLLLRAHPSRAGDPVWWGHALLANVAGLSVLLIANPFTVFATLVSFMVLAGHTLAPARSTLVNGLCAGLSIARSPYDAIMAGTGHFSRTNGTQRRTAVAVLIAVIAAIPFMLLYRISNPLFDRWIGAIKLDWFNAGWCLFTVFGFFVVYGLIKTRRFQVVDHTETQLLADARPAAPGTSSPQAFSVLGIALFAMLNLMLLLMNGLDAAQIYVHRQLPEGITLSAFVHEAVTATIVSIVFAAAFIVVLFRGDLNFTAQGRPVRWLVYGWMAQTALVIVNTMVRNGWYIGEYHLTHQRIGVYIFLALALIGLVVTWFKVSRAKSAWWLIAANTRVWYVALVLLGAVNWNRIITTYNIGKAAGTGQLDRDYLLRMGESNLPQLVELHRTHPFTGEQLEKLRDRVAWEEKEINEVQPFGRGWPGYSLRFARNRDAIAAFREMEQ